MSAPVAPDPDDGRLVDSAGRAAPTASEAQWTDVLPVRSLRPDRAIRVRAGGQRLVVGVSDGEVFAVADVCPHLDLPLAAFGPLDLQGGRLVCPWHYWEFDVRTGRCAYAPFYQEDDLFYFQLEGRAGPVGESAGSLRHLPARIRGDVVQVLVPPRQRGADEGKGGDEHGE